MKRVVLLTLCCLLAFTPLRASAKDDIVSTAKEKYSYREMYEDLTLLAEAYPEQARLEVAGHSVWGQEIPLLIVGNRDARRSILIQGAMHAREYMTTLLIMKQIEYILQNPGLPYQDSTVGEILEKCSIWFLPMVNPDGVRLSQSGLSGLEDKGMRTALLAMNNGKTDFSEWKSNGRGVDLNRNYPANWTQSRFNPTPASSNYAGKYPGSEPETVALIRATLRSDARIILSYHSRGSYMYWYYGQTGAIYARDKAIAEEIKQMTGYYFAGESESLSGNSGYKDWCTSMLKRPAYTLEIGSTKYSAPQPISEFPDIWKRNRLVPIHIAWRALHTNIR